MVRMDTYNRINNVSKTIHGKECQNWESNYPHKNTTYNSRRYPNADLGNHNYCRNPDGQEEAWCFTEDPDVEKEGCGFKSHKTPFIKSIAISGLILYLDINLIKLLTI